MRGRLQKEDDDMKTETTKQLERLLCNKFDPRKDFFVFECTIGWYGGEIVDCICYNCNRETLCYEIKQSVSDFRSKNHVTFIGDKNYYVMPYDLYEKVKAEIPTDIGVYVSCHREMKEKTVPNERGYSNVWITQYYTEFSPGFDELVCVKPAKKRLLRADKEIILSSMLRCACRDRSRGDIFGYGSEE